MQGVGGTLRETVGLGLGLVSVASSVSGPLPLSVGEGVGQRLPRPLPAPVWYQSPQPLGIVPPRASAAPGLHGVGRGHPTLFLWDPWPLSLHRHPHNMLSWTPGRAGSRPSRGGGRRGKEEGKARRGPASVNQHKGCSRQDILSLQKPSQVPTNQPDRLTGCSHLTVACCLGAGEGSACGCCQLVSLLGHSGHRRR